MFFDKSVVALLGLAAAVCCAPRAQAQDASEAPPGAVGVSSSALTPTYLALSPNINDFTRFADGGPDGNWYIGFNNAWIVKLPSAPAGDWARADIGARIGRAQTRPDPNKPWIREVIDGKVYMAISPTPAWTTEQSYFLAETSDISVEPDPTAELNGLGPAQWFWAEVPLSMISMTKPNYLIIWSPTKFFVRASSAPILAAAAADEAEGEALAWNNHSILGVPPRSATYALETPLNNIHPALAIKLVPTTSSDLNVTDFTLARDGRRVIASFSANGQDVSAGWLESSRDQLDWSRVTRYRRQPPFYFTLPPEHTPGPGSFLRGVVRDGLGNTSASAPIQIPYGSR